MAVLVILVVFRDKIYEILIGKWTFCSKLAIKRLCTMKGNRDMVILKNSAIFAKMAILARNNG